MGWFQEAKAWKESDPSVTYRQIAEKFGIARQTVKNRFCREKKRAEDEPLDYSLGHRERKPEAIDRGDFFLVYWPSAHRACEITKDDLRKLKELYCEQRMTVNQVCRELDIPRPDFFLIKTAFGITKDDVPFLDEDIMEGDLDELTDLSLQRQKRNYFITLEQKRYDHALRELAEYRKKDYFTNKLIEGLSRAVKPIPYQEPKYTPPQTIVRRRRALAITLSDTHRGKLVLSSELVTDNQYNVDVFDQRMARYLDEIIEYAKETKPEYTVMFNTGDGVDDPNAHTYINQLAHQDEHAEQQLKGYVRALRDFILSVRDHMKLTKYVQSKGNHKGDESMTNWDLVVAMMLQLLFEDYDDLEIDARDTMSKVTRLYNSAVVTIHGDVLPKTETKGENKILNLMRLHGLTDKRTYILQGHLHHFESTKYSRIYLPSMVGSDDLSENHMMITSRPSQVLLLFDERDGLVDQHFVYFDEL
jgi:hypothetical protein